MAVDEPGHNGQSRHVDYFRARRDNDTGSRPERLNSPIIHQDRSSLDHWTGATLPVHCYQAGVAKRYEPAPSSPWNSEIDLSQQLAFRLARTKDINLVRPAEDHGIAAHPGWKQGAMVTDFL